MTYKLGRGSTQFPEIQPPHGVDLDDVCDPRGHTCHQEVQHVRDGGGRASRTCLGTFWRNFLTEILNEILTEILTLQAGFFDLEAGIYTNKKSNPVGTCQKLTIQAGWP